MAKWALTSDIWLNRKQNFSFEIYSIIIIILITFADVTSGAGLISQALLANADALCAAVSPLMDPDETLLLVLF